MQRSVAREPACSAFLLCTSFRVEWFRFVHRRIANLYRAPRFVRTQTSDEQKRPGESRLISPCFEPRLIAASKTSLWRLSFPLSFLPLFLPPVPRRNEQWTFLAIFCNLRHCRGMGSRIARARVFTEERSSHSRLAVPNTFPIFVLRHSLNHRRDRPVFSRLLANTQLVIHRFT